MDRHEEALKCFEEVLELDPRDKYAWNNKGIALNGLGRYVEALKCYDNALELDPESELVQNNRNLVLMRLERFEEALNEIESISSKAKEKIKKRNLPEKQEKEKFLEVDAQYEVRKELNSDYMTILNAKETYESKLADLLKSRSEPLKDNFFIILRRWNSYTPTMLTSTKFNLGGGYFLHWKGKGIVIDPGFNFLDNFFNNGLLIDDIDAVIITHAL